MHTGVLDTAEIEKLRKNPEFDSLFDEMDAGMIVEHERVPVCQLSLRVAARNAGGRRGPYC